MENPEEDARLWEENERLAGRRKQLSNMPQHRVQSNTRLFFKAIYQLAYNFSELSKKF
jgi:hypothetical protein